MKAQAYLFSDSKLKECYGISGRRMKLSQEELKIHGAYYNQVVEFVNSVDAEGEVLTYFTEDELRQQMNVTAFAKRRALYIFYDIEDIHRSAAFNHLLRSTAYYNITVWVTTTNHSPFAHLIERYNIAFYIPSWPRVLSWASCASTASSASTERKLTDQK